MGGEAVHFGVYKQPVQNSTWPLALCKTSFQYSMYQPSSTYALEAFTLKLSTLKVGRPPWTLCQYDKNGKYGNALSSHLKITMLFMILHWIEIVFDALSSDRFMVPNRLLDSIHYTKSKASNPIIANISDAQVYRQLGYESNDTALHSEFSHYCNSE